MKKITTLFFSLLWFATSAPTSLIGAQSPPSPPIIPIITEMVFVHILRDMELLNYWLLDKDYSKETLENVYNQNCQKIFTLHKVNATDFQTSKNYYLEDSIERAIQVYNAVYAALGALIIPASHGSETNAG